MRVAICTRVSTTDKEQDPETQLVALRDFCNAQAWEVHRQYVERESALDVAHRTAWRELLDDAAKRKFKWCWSSSWTAPSAPCSMQQ